MSIPYTPTEPMGTPDTTNLKALETDASVVTVRFDKNASRLDNLQWQGHMNRFGHALTGFRFTDRDLIQNSDAPLWRFVRTCC